MKQRFCNICNEHNCIKHAAPNGLTQRLTNLLEYFESEPEEKDMRTYIAPDKNKSNRSNKSLPTVGENFDRHDTRLNSFSNDSLKDMSAAEQIIMMPRSTTPAVSTTAIVRVGDTNQEFIPNGPPKLQQLTGGRYKSHERHHFVKIHASSFVSCSSPTGIYSELAIVLWVDNKTYSKSSNDRYRVILSLMYDSEDDLWSISSKLIKRGAYLSSKDEEEGQINNRLCLTSELRSEMKKMLLYLGISPRDAYRKFRRNMEEKFVVTASEFGFTTVENASHSILVKDLDKAVPTNIAGWNHHRRHFGGHQYPQGHHVRGVDPDMYKDALAGYPGMGDDCWNND